MPPTIDEVLAALPEGADEPASTRAVPVGRMRRMWALGTIQAKIAAGYAAWWIRGFGSSADKRQQRLNETHLKSAIRLLGEMGYLRGAAMKVGQVLAHYPDVMPLEYAETLGRLHFEAPPMHFSLLRELFHNELDGDPESFFDDFEPSAFAAASLGQVHRARLRGSGRSVAIKIQYPDIGRTIRDDCRNMRTIIAPMRLSGDWDSLQRQFDDVTRMLELESDYEHEAENQRIARAAFREDDGIVVPRVHADLSTRRVLTMDLVEGLHLKEYMATDPPQEERDRFGHLISVALNRLSYQSNLLYADVHPGNFIFMPDGRLGLIDFGCCHRYTDDDVDYMSEVERGAKSSPEALRKALLRAVDLTELGPRDEHRMELVERWSRWVFEPVYAHEGPFDFSDADYFKEGITVHGEMLRKRYVRSRPVNTWLSKGFFGLRAMLYHLRACVDLGAVIETETSVR